MATCKINFTKESNPLAYGIYQDMLETGASCEALDYGYNVTNYAGIHGPKKDARSCVKGKGDGVVEADEVMEYALDNYEQAKYRQIIEGRLGEPLPWVLDDLDPATTFDAEIRERVQTSIDELKRIIKAKGVAEGSEKYKEMLAAGLTWFVATPPIWSFQIATDGIDIQKMKDQINKDGLEEFGKYLEKNGGISVKYDSNTEEYAAIEALKNKKGACTETSKILFAAMKMAGLQPVFIDEDIQKEETNDPVIKEAVGNLPIGKKSSHVCIGLYIGKRIRLFDSTLKNSNTDYKLYVPISLRQYLSQDYNNRGLAWRANGELDKAIAGYTMAIAIDPKFAPAYSNRGYAWKINGELDKAMADHTNAIAINPKFAYAYNNRGTVWVNKNKLGNAIADFTSALNVDSKYAMAYYNRGLAWEIKGEFDKAIVDMARAAALEYAQWYDDLLTTTRKKWQSSNELENTASLFWDETGGADIAAYEAQLVLAYALWEFKKYEEALKIFKGILTYLSFKAKPSQSTTDFFNDMLQKMSAPMRKDKGVQKTLRSLQKKMKEL